MSKEDRIAEIRKESERFASARNLSGVTVFQLMGLDNLPVATVSTEDGDANPTIGAVMVLLSDIIEMGYRYGIKDGSDDVLAKLQREMADEETILQAKRMTRDQLSVSLREANDDFASWESRVKSKMELLRAATEDVPF